MNDMLEAVKIPKTWENKSYISSAYHLVNVRDVTVEFADVEKYFADFYVERVERVQNPFQLGRYLVHKLQMNTNAEATRFMPLQDEDDLTLALQYNCDYRRLGYDYNMFFHSAYEAAKYSDYEKMLVVQTLIGNSQHDSGRYAKYVVAYEPFVELY